MANRTCSYNPIERVVFCPREDGSAEVWLHEDIRQQTIRPHDDAEGYDLYTADEVHFKTRHSREYVEENFDALWVAAEKSTQSVSERLNEVEDLVGALIDLELMKEE